jgi:large subunit ribosomal protein L22
MTMEKTYIATQKYLIMSPRKLRLVVALIKKMKPVDVIERMPFVEKRAGEPLAKVIKSAMANARQQGASDTDLVFKEIQIGEGPRLKRGRPASRGRWHPFKKRMSHIRVVLTTVVKKEEKSSPKEVKATEVKEEKPEKKTVKAKVVKEEKKS